MDLLSPRNDVALLLLGIFITRFLLDMLLHCFIHFTLFLRRSLPLFNPTRILKPKAFKVLLLLLFFFTKIFILLLLRERERERV